MKRCTQCGEIKSLSEFHKRKQCHDGLNTRCATCMCFNEKTYRDENKNNIGFKTSNKERVKKYYDKNKYNPDFIEKRNIKNAIQRAKKRLTKNNE